MDMVNLEQIRHATYAVSAGLGELDVLVDNTGVAPMNLALNVSEEDFDRTLKHKSQRHLLCCQPAADLRT